MTATDSHRETPGETRSRVMSVLLRQGPVSAADIGEQLGLSAAGVRRHVDKLLDEGLAEACSPRPVAGEEAGRGRPARHFQLTEAGRGHFGSGYDTLALDAVDLVEQLGGQDAVRAFARNRVEKILGPAAAGGADPATETEVSDAVERVADALERAGYEPSVRRTGAGIQLCQHHCPVSAVAAEHPELCEAEHEAIAEIVGTHIQSLALIADGHGVCTTNIPLAAVAAGTQTERKRSGDHDES